MFRISFTKEGRENPQKARKHSPLKIGIVGIGGRTGTMFAFELKNWGEVFGIGREEDVKLIEKKRVFIQRGNEKILFQGNLIKEKEFPGGVFFDAIFLTVKNPIENALFYYYQKIKDLKFKPPALFLSQNGIEAGEKALFVLEKIFGKRAKEIPVFRISLFNPVEKIIEGDKILIFYSLPIKLAISRISGNDESLLEIFKSKNFEIFYYPPEKAKEMEFSKLFLNLIGMVSASYNLSIKEGFSKREIFKEEILALKEFIKVAKAKKIKFLNFPHYPVKFLSFLFSLPDFLLFPLSKFLAKKIERERIGKKKELDEIDFYNGAVVKLAEELGIEVPVNLKILERAKKWQKKFSF